MKVKKKDSVAKLYAGCATNRLDIQKMNKLCPGMEIENDDGDDSCDDPYKESDIPR